jgi:16S rRNA (cytosine1402-N4)-methyltransferase
MTSEFHHIPVLGREIIDGLNVRANGHYLDATLGGGGHTRLILEAFPDTRVTAIDRDETALEAVRTTLSNYIPDRLTLRSGNFADFDPKEIRFEGILADLGVSSPQFDRGDRGFSFRHTAPLDMRMDRRQSLTAGDIINYHEEKELADLFYEYGEERLSRRIARAIVAKRPFETTTQLAEAIAYSVPRSYRYGRIHPATRVFQALRIAVNGELESLKVFLDKAVHWLAPEGIIGVISFHSLEDRIIKYHFRDSELLTVVTKKPIVPTKEEESNNPRARSAKLRLARRVA